MIKPLTKISYIKLYYTSVFLVVTVFIILALLMQSHFRESSSRQKAMSLAYSKAQLNAANFRVNLQQVRYLFEHNLNERIFALKSIDSKFKKIKKQFKPSPMDHSSEFYDMITMAYEAFHNGSIQQGVEKSTSDPVTVLYHLSIASLEDVLDDADILMQNGQLNQRGVMLIEQLIEDIKAYSYQDPPNNQEIKFLLGKNSDLLAINNQLLINLKLANARTQLLEHLKKLREDLNSVYSNFERTNKQQQGMQFADINRTLNATSALLSVYVNELPIAKDLYQLKLEQLSDSKMSLLSAIMFSVAVIGIILIYWIQRIVQIRIESISNHVTAIESRDYATRETFGSSDDLGKLANTMNEVALSLNAKDILIHQQLELLAKSEKELQEANKLLEDKVSVRSQELKLASRIVESIDEAVMVTNQQNRIISVNPAYTRITGYTISDLINTIPHFMAQVSIQDSVNEQLQQSGKWVGEYESPCKTGNYCLVRISLILLFDEHKVPSHRVAIITDITEQKKYQQQLEKFAYYDPLTQLPNRRLYRERIDYFCGVGERDGLKRALLFIDLDNFKTVNDTLGHEAGDIVLLTVSKRLNNTIRRKSDYISRLGGDEFTAILDPIKNKQDIAKMAVQIIRDIAIPISIFGQNVKIGCSIGIAEYPKDGKDYAALNRSADLAMYKAKEMGKNTYVFYENTLDHITSEQLNFDLELSRALEKNEFVIHYQPKWRLEDEKIVGFEALIRWNKNNVLLAPDQFISLLESNRHIIEVGMWVIKQAMQQALTWQKSYGRILPIAVNVSAVQLLDPEFVATVTALKQQYLLPDGALELEITKSLMMGYDKESTLIQQQLVAQGISLAVDGFGTGYSSMLYLKYYPVKTLKIDRCFIKDLDNSKDSQAIVVAVLCIAEKLSLEVVAEGIENEQQLAALKQLNEKQIVIHCQGFYLSRAVDSNAIDSLISESGLL
jgi:diguanylate cyclase (GGDEF)-like protein/PAS domain S-box-containing protein